LRRINLVCNRFEAAWKAGQRPRIEDHLGEVAEPERPSLLRELLAMELSLRRRGGETPAGEEYRKRFPEHAGLVQAVFDEKAGVASKHPGKADASHIGVRTVAEPVGAGGAGAPPHLGRYRVTAQLGQGSFGIVYQGYDDELRREVAIKVPHRHRVSQPEDVEAYLAEARVLAGLDHPHIVPVHDVGRTDDGLCYVVSKFIAGSDLAKKIQEARPSVTQSAELVAAVAEALHYAHHQGLVHRDIKPGNILIGTSGKPYVADFGLALKEEDFGRGAGWSAPRPT
jgi:predicted Ser/Thr protein kinase